MRYSKTMMICLLVLCLLLSACGGAQTAAVTESETESTAPAAAETAAEAPAEAPDEAQAEASGEATVEEPSAADISERAMDNFLVKVYEGDYTIEDGSFLKTTVHSKDLVCFDYTDDMYNDLVYMSIGNETFRAVRTGDGLGEVSYVKEGQAINAVSKRLINCWMDDDVSEGNIYNLFYNMMDDPLKFVSYEDIVKRSLLSFAGYGETVLPSMEEVYLVLDAEDPSVAHLQCVVKDDPVARIYIDDIDVIVTFGGTEGDPYAAEWMEAPAYPEARTGWTDSDIFIFNSVFLPGYGEDAVPFPEFASYALVNDEENFVMNDAAFLRDPHASEEDMAAYARALVEAGFTEVRETGEDGNETVRYLRMLREEALCYASITLEYDDGVNITAKKYYDLLVCEDAGEINETLAEFGYPELPESSAVKALKATDRKYEQTESWLYFFDYDLLLYVDVDCDDYDAAASWLKDYADALGEAGFRASTDSDEEEGDAVIYASENGFRSFRYHFEPDGALTLLFKSERYISAQEASEMIVAAGFPEIELRDFISCRDLKTFEKLMYGLDLRAFIAVSQPFDTVDEAGAFFDAYEAALNEAGFDRENPSVAGTTKQIAFVNADGTMTVGIDFFEQGEGAAIYFDFRAD